MSALWASYSTGVGAALGGANWGEQPKGTAVHNIPCSCLLMAHSGHRWPDERSLLSGVKRTQQSLRSDVRS
jgi:hypothetical protein